ncbi:hypothetical protein BDP27DRAFT_1333138 [Rhodocollybia butyracea]|uniref:Uncharacterized protein n=1 Tax=Rhodocollybia butyracea TaxID=206335 RepID=A0A9P5PLD9_9AGAR|nr:hypothetical protein BDP27DRAFT_1333138 [Rhodocollybia butyracea]
MVSFGDVKCAKKTKHRKLLFEDTEFLYNVDIYDPKDPERGLFRGYILYRVIRLFQLKSMAVKNGMQKVTSRHMTYAAVQACFALSASETWNHDNDNFSDAEFYSKIADYDPGDERVVHWKVGTRRYSVISKGGKIAPSSKKNASLEMAQRLLLQLH